MNSYSVYRKEPTGKDVEWKAYYGANHWYADIINGIGCDCVQLVKDTDLEEVDVTSGKKSRDMIRKVALGVSFVLIGIENQEVVDYVFSLLNDASFLVGYSTVVSNQ